MDLGARDRWLAAWALGFVAVGIASLLVPLYAVSLGGGPFVVGVLASTAAFAAVPGALLWGWLAATTGNRRGLVLFALVATAALLAVTPLIRAPGHLVLVNTLLWFVVSAAAPVLTLIAVEGAPEPEWEVRIGALNAWQGYGWVGGLVLGSTWVPLAGRVVGPGAARRWLFVVAALAAGLGALLAGRWLPTAGRVGPDRIERDPELLARIVGGAGRYVRAVPFATTRLYWSLRGIRREGGIGTPPARLRRYLLAVALFSTGFATFWGPLPAFLAGSYADAQVFWFFLATNVAAAALFTRVGRWAADRGSLGLQTGALALRAALFPLVAVVALAAGPPVELPLLLLVFGLIGLTWAVIAVTATSQVTRLARDDLAGGLGLHAAVAGLGGGVGGVLGGSLATSVGYTVTFAVAAALVLASAIVVVGAVGVGSPGDPSSRGIG